MLKLAANNPKRFNKELSELIENSSKSVRPEGFDKMYKNFKEVIGNNDK